MEVAGSRNVVDVNVVRMACVLFNCNNTSESSKKSPADCAGSKPLFKTSRTGPGSGLGSIPMPINAMDWGQDGQALSESSEKYTLNVTCVSNEHCIIRKRVICVYLNLQFE